MDGCDCTREVGNEERPQQAAASVGRQPRVWQTKAAHPAQWQGISCALQLVRIEWISTTNPQNSLIVLRLQQQHAIKGPCLLLLVTGAAAAAGPGAGAGGLAG